MLTYLILMVPTISPIYPLGTRFLASRFTRLQPSSPQRLRQECQVCAILYIYSSQQTLRYLGRNGAYAVYIHEKDMFLVMADIVLETLIQTASLPTDNEMFGRTLRGLWVKLEMLEILFIKSRTIFKYAYISACQRL